MGRDLTTKGAADPPKEKFQRKLRNNLAVKRAYTARSRLDKYARAMFDVECDPDFCDADLPDKVKRANELNKRHVAKPTPITSELYELFLEFLHKSPSLIDARNTILAHQMHGLNWPDVLRRLYQLLKAEMDISKIRTGLQVIVDHDNHIIKTYGLNQKKVKVPKEEPVADDMPPMAAVDRNN